jgi:hypothetical protein
MSGFAVEARRAFGFLEHDFGARLHESRGRGRAGRVAYRSATAFVHVGREAREPDLVVELGPLEGGTPGRAIPLSAVLEARGAAIPADDDLPGWAAALRAHATPMLDGDFSRLEDVDAVLERRRAEMEAQAAEIRRRAQERHAGRSRLGRLWDRLR